MDNITIDRVEHHCSLGAAQRHFRNGLPVRAVGYMPAKKNRAHRTFDRLSFMFTLQGDGDYRRDEILHRVQSPCVMVGYPGTVVEYGPDRAWEVLYINFVAEFMPEFEERNLVDPNRPVWPIHDVAAIRHRIIELLSALKDVHSFGSVDLIDRQCENLIVESLIGAAIPPSKGNDRAINSIRAYLETHYRESVDFNKLALMHGLSTSDFRRKWGARMNVAPGEFVCQLRIREASRLLVESEKSIKEIATSVGYNDPLYFSRRFRQITGESATDYRRSFDESAATQKS